MIVCLYQTKCKLDPLQCIAMKEEEEEEDKKNNNN